MVFSDLSYLVFFFLFLLFLSGQNLVFLSPGPGTDSGFVLVSVFFFFQSANTLNTPKKKESLRGEVELIEGLLAPSLMLMEPKGRRWRRRRSSGGG